MESTTVETAFLISGGIIALFCKSESLCMFFTAFMDAREVGDLVFELDDLVRLAGGVRLGVIHRFLKFVGCAFPIKLHDVGNRLCYSVPCTSPPPEVDGVTRCTAADGVTRCTAAASSRFPDTPMFWCKFPDTPKKITPAKQVTITTAQTQAAGFVTRARGRDERRALIVRRHGDVRCLDVHRDVSKRAPQGRACRCSFL